MQVWRALFCPGARFLGARTVEDEVLPGVVHVADRGDGQRRAGVRADAVEDRVRAEALVRAPLAREPGGFCWALPGVYTGLLE